MHDFFLERDYPAATELVRVAGVLTPEYQPPDQLRQRLRMDEETFNRAVEKLASHAAAVTDFDGNVRGTENTHAKSWRSGYDQQLAFRRSQIDRMVAYAESPQCRMTALIQHFGDTSDGLRPCGHCDFCSPERATAQPFREPTTQETRQLHHILAALDNGQARATGKLHTDLALGIDRKQFDAYLDALARAGLIQLNPDTFTNPEAARSPSSAPPLLTKAAPATKTAISESSSATPPKPPPNPARRANQAALRDPPKLLSKPNGSRPPPLTPPRKKISKLVSASGAKPKPPKPASPPSSSSATPSCTTSYSPHHRRSPSF